MVKVNLPEADTSDPRFKNYDFEYAKDLYDVLLNFSDTIDNREMGAPNPYYPAVDGQLRWIFRGQWDATKTLLPSAFREPDENQEKWNERFRLKTDDHDTPVTPQPNRTARVIDKKHLDYSPPKTIKQRFKKQVETEYFILRKFMETANTLGIDCNYTPYFYDYNKKVREADANYQKTIKGVKNKDLEKWPDGRILSVMALAQHHRLPTRLLDFTYNPLLAAFFAAQNSFEKRDENIEEDKKLCIWAIDEKINLHTLGVLPNRPLRKIPAPNNRSGNLFSQEGVLILDTSANSRFIKGGGKWLDLITRRKIHGLVKLTLPRGEAKELLCLLWEHNIIPARIMPNLDSVTQTLEYTQWLWTKNKHTVSKSRIPPLDTPPKTL